MDMDIDVGYLRDGIVEPRRVDLDPSATFQGRT